MLRIDWSSDSDLGKAPRSIGQRSLPRHERVVAHCIEHDHALARHPSQLLDQLNERIVAEMVCERDADGDVDALVAERKIRRVTHDCLHAGPPGE